MFFFYLDRNKEALESLKWIYETEAEAQNQLKNVKKIFLSSKQEKTLPTNDFSAMLKPPYKWPFCIALMLHIGQQTTGMPPIVSFLGHILEQSNSPIDISYVSLGITIVNLAALGICPRILEKYSRKAIINMSSQLVIVSLLVLSVHLWAKGSSGVLHNFAISLTWVHGRRFTIDNKRKNRWLNCGKQLGL